MELRHADFTNPDPRMRPQWPLRSDPNFPHTYQITAQAFPEFYAEYQRMMRQAGLPAYSIFVTDAASPFAGRYYEHSRQILINRSLFNTISFDDLLSSTVGHEIGHAWRKNNPNAPRIPTPTDFSDRKYIEYEADMLAVCLRNDTSGRLAWMDRYHRSDTVNYPSNDELRAGMRRMRWDDCPFPSGPMAVSNASGLLRRDPPAK